MSILQSVMKWKFIEVKLTPTMGCGTCHPRFKIFKKKTKKTKKNFYTYGGRGMPIALDNPVNFSKVFYDA